MGDRRGAHRGRRGHGGVTRSAHIAGAVLGWYRENRRDLPWRRTRDPYAIWISEAMLQQTRVDTVIPYWHRFLTKFPTVGELAVAPVDDVLKLWEGLGYYSRARNLHRAAGLIVSDFGGRLPDSATQLKTLPGIGPYMAGAVASIAFQKPEPVLDGNVERVLTRLHGISDSVSDAKTKKNLWQLAAGLVPETSPGDFNQGMMELGATVCTPKGPGCVTCPLTAPCVAHAEGTPEAYPVKLKKAPAPHHDIAVGVVRYRGKLLLVRRPERGLLGGLWEFPGGRLQASESPGDGVIKRLKERFSLSVTPGEPLTPVKHVFTHRRVTLHPFLCEAASESVAPGYHSDFRWVPPGGVTGLALPRAHQKILESLEKSGG